jgi:sodium-dependent dicarboxylate transporter 2/3/5
MNERTAATAALEQAAAAAEGPAGGRRTARIGLFAGAAAMAACLFLPVDGLPFETRAVLGLLLLMAIWWITETLPVAATALLPIVALPLIGIEVAVDERGRLVCAVEGMCAAAGAEGVRPLNLADLSAHYANPVVLLYIGGFLLGVAIERWGLSTRIAYALVARAGASPRLMLAGFVAASGFLSMWISNTSTSMILTPLALSVAAGAALGGADVRRFAGSLVLAVCYGATIGGLATPIGTPTNGIALQQLRAQGIEVSFGEWMLVGLPVTLALLPIAWAILARGAAVDQAGALAARERVRASIAGLGRMSVAEMRVALVFLVTAALWVASSPIADAVGAAWLGAPLAAQHVDTMIATLAALAFFIIPAGRGAEGQPSRPLLTWDDAARIPWGILLLFGGGLALAAGAELSGLTDWMSHALDGVTGVPAPLLILGVGALVIVITEFASNIAAISLMGPVLLALAAGSGMGDPTAFIVPAAMAASMGFAMPVGSAANAIAFGTGRLPLLRMIRLGLAMNVAALAVVTLAALTLAPLVLG